jgi:hypothetical protein
LASFFLTFPATEVKDLRIDFIIMVGVDRRRDTMSFDEALRQGMKA